MTSKPAFAARSALRWRLLLVGVLWVAVPSAERLMLLKPLNQPPAAGLPLRVRGAVASAAGTASAAVLVALMQSVTEGLSSCTCSALFNE